MSKELTDAKRRAILKYDSANTRQIHLKLNINTDADILAKLGEQKSIQGYIKSLIRKDMEKTEREAGKEAFQGYLTAQAKKAIDEGRLCLPEI